MIYAGFWRRFAAHIIDWAVISTAMCVIWFPLMLLLGGSMAGHDLIKAAEHRQAEAIKLQADSHGVQKTTPRGNTPKIAPSAPAADAAEPADDTSEENSSDQEYSTSMQDQAKDSPFGGMILFIYSVIYLLTFAGSTIYHTYFVGSKWQATPGKRVMNCCVVSRNGARIDYGHACGRHIACFLSWFPFAPFCIGFFLAGWTREKKALHDMITGTRVVRTVAQLPVVATVSS